MKKIISMMLSLVIFAMSIPIFAQSGSESGVIIGEYDVWSDTAFFEDVEYEGKKISITIEGKYLEYFTSVFSDESLVYDEEQTLSENNLPTYEKLPRFYVEDNREKNIHTAFILTAKELSSKRILTARCMLFLIKTTVSMMKCRNF